MGFLCFKGFRLPETVLAFVFPKTMCFFINYRHCEPNEVRRGNLLIRRTDFYFSGCLKAFIIIYSMVRGLPRRDFITARNDISVSNKLLTAMSFYYKLKCSPK
ncbi:MAG: hypothetical protein IJV35_09190 [Neisseriaceae bacterium]|nr:hypothetical protein [Neisseriaceae bacterium]